MVGVVLVSHSRALALAAQELVRAMTGPSLPLAVAAGAGENHAELGTDAVEIQEAIQQVMGDEGVLVLMDMGSAILSAETALDFLDEPARAKVRLCAAPFVEGAVAAGVTANLGAPLDRVLDEARRALAQKEGSLKHAAAEAETAEPVPAPAPAETAAPKPAEQTVRVVVRNPHGLHARPAARLIQEAGAFQAEITVKNVRNGRGPVSARSLSSLASLEVLEGNEIELAASGPDAAPALLRLAGAIGDGLGEKIGAAPAPAAGSSATSRPSGKSSPGEVLRPIPIADGWAIGPAFYLEAIGPEIPTAPAADPATEVKRLREAVEAVRRALVARQAEMGKTVGAEHAAIFEAQQAVLLDPELVETAARAVEREKLNAAQAWDRAAAALRGRYESLQDAYLRERAADVRDVSRQVLEFLLGRASDALRLPQPGILVAEDLTPHQVSALDRSTVRGVLLLEGGPTAHSSILLRALGLPAIVRARAIFPPERLARLGAVAFNGATGEIWPEPDAELLDKLRRGAAEAEARAAEEKKEAHHPGATADGTRIEIFANVGHGGEAEAAVALGAEGVGLLRTEFLFLQRDAAPDEEDQVAALGQIFAGMAGRPVIVRTLDAGGDKELPYLGLPREQNPFLGVRAIRLCLAHRALFLTQLRAILRAAVTHDVRVMFPMIAGLDDLQAARQCLEEAHRRLAEEAVPHAWPVPVGIMVEVPAAALQAEALAAAADFFSIGTNDLTQYAQAADRGNPALGSYQDALHPAVLRLIDLTVRGAQKHRRLVAVCGEAAADEQAAAVLVGLGVRELSLSAARIPRIKAALRRRRLGDLRKLAEAALNCRTAAEVRALAAN